MVSHDGSGIRDGEFVPSSIAVASSNGTQLTWMATLVLRICVSYRDDGEKCRQTHWIVMIGAVLLDDLSASPDRSFEACTYKDQLLLEVQ